MDEPKTCATCAHLVGVRSQTQFHEGWLCGAPENILEKNINLVTGIEEPVYKIRQCVEVRKPHWEIPQKMVSCGPEGRWWLLYTPPEYHPRSASRAPGKVSADELLKELES